MTECKRYSNSAGTVLKSAQTGLEMVNRISLEKDILSDIAHQDNEAIPQSRTVNRINATCSCMTSVNYVFDGKVQKL